MLSNEVFEASNYGRYTSNVPDVINVTLLSRWFLLLANLATELARNPSILAYDLNTADMAFNPTHTWARAYACTHKNAHTYKHKFNHNSASGTVLFIRHNVFSL